MDSLSPPHKTSEEMFFLDADVALNWWQPFSWTEPSPDIKIPLNFFWPGPSSSSFHFNHAAVSSQKMYSTWQCYTSLWKDVAITVLRGTKRQQRERGSHPPHRAWNMDTFPLRVTPRLWSSHTFSAALSRFLFSYIKHDTNSNNCMLSSSFSSLRLLNLQLLSASLSEERVKPWGCRCNVHCPGELTLERKSEHGERFWFMGAEPHLIFISAAVAS